MLTAFGYEMAKKHGIISEEVEHTFLFKRKQTVFAALFSIIGATVCLLSSNLFSSLLLNCEISHRRKMRRIEEWERISKSRDKRDERGMQEGKREGRERRKGSMIEVK